LSIGYITDSTGISGGKTMMKKNIGKITSILLGMLMVISLAACGGKEPAEESNLSESSHELESHEDASGTVSASEMEGGEDETEEHKILVVYFSATNTTKGVAETIADVLSADIYEITPVEPYTDADLDYNDDNSRSTIEMNDKTIRPAIAGSVENIGQYEYVWIGFPIWWSQAPRILSTFVESYDFSGKTIVPFCTSGSSGIGSSALELEALTDGATWLPGTRLNGGSSRSEIVEWVNSLELDIQVE
jgi:Flavodoxins